VKERRKDGREFDLHPATPLGGGRFACTLAAGASEVHVLVDAAGFLRRFQAGPFRVDDVGDGAIDVELPAPGTLTATFGPPSDARDPLPYATCGFEVMRFAELPSEGTRGFPIAELDEPSPRASLSLFDLAPGEYRVEAFTGTRATRRDFARPGAFSAQGNATIESGKPVDLAFEYEAFDESSLRGDYSADLAVRRQDGEPAAGLAYELEHFDPAYGPKALASGQVPEDGTIRVEGLPGGDRALHATLHVGGSRLGDVYRAGDEKSRTISFSLPPGAGDPAPGVQLLDVFAEKNVRLSDLRGEVLLLDFWTTWCGPCQEPMAHNSEVLRRRETDWKGKARILAISLDEDRTTLIEHVRRKGWENVPHLFAEDGGAGWKSTAATAYGVTGVPTSFLVDAHGFIRWRGHPDGFDLEGEIDALLEKAAP
jgi:thiol-disulfide isomerase/thioredoxin